MLGRQRTRLCHDRERVRYRSAAGTLTDFGVDTIARLSSEPNGRNSTRQNTVFIQRRRFYIVLRGVVIYVDVRFWFYYANTGHRVVRNTRVCIYTY